MHNTLFIFLFFLSLKLLGNDGSYYTSGNQLIPIYETDISVKKEVLQIIRINESEVKIIVDYQFFNPTDGKEIIVGFEAPSPQGDVDGHPKNGQHPYIRDFTVVLNEEFLSYNTAIVRDSNYEKDGSIQSNTVEEIIDEDFDETYPNFFYVNYFHAYFKKGLNTLKHEYIYKLAGSVDNYYSLSYILTAANRWSNKQIDDFTLIIDLGDFLDFNINRTFFTGFEGWSNAHKLMDGEGFQYEETKTNPMRALTNDQALVFKKLNFKPRGELYLYSKRDFSDDNTEGFNYLVHSLPYDLQHFGFVSSTRDDESYKILRNYPFARRGYVFKTAVIQQYYESMDWYVPNPKYQATVEDLSELEKNWLKKLKERH